MRGCPGMSDRAPGPRSTADTRVMSTASSTPLPALDYAASRRVALLVAAAFFMEQLDASIIVTALPGIAGGFGVPVLAAGSGVTVYLLAMTVFVPAAGW